MQRLPQEADAQGGRRILRQAVAESAQEDVQRPFNVSKPFRIVLFPWLY